MHPGQKLKPGAVVRFEGAAGVLMGEVLARHFQGRRTIRLWSESGSDVTSLIDALGHVPLPPYIHRDDTAADRERYQTVFARERGSVAAPTAGLHFTSRASRRADAHAASSALTSRCTWATARSNPSKSIASKITSSMPSRISISEAAAAAISRARAERRRIIAVGTTTTRALEDAARRGGGVVRSGSGVAEIFIYPGFDFQVVNGLLTNFHLPKSSLLMLVCRLCRQREVLRRLPDRRRGALQVLQLRGCDAHRVTAAVGGAARWASGRALSQPEPAIIKDSCRCSSVG